MWSSGSGCSGSVSEKLAGWMKHGCALAIDNNAAYDDVKKKGDLNLNQKGDRIRLAPVLKQSLQLEIPSHSYQFLQPSLKGQQQEKRHSSKKCSKAKQ